MAVSGALRADLARAVEGSQVLVVGAGGIGCELLKNLVLTGFTQLHVVSEGSQSYHHPPHNTMGRPVPLYITAEGGLTQV